MPEILTKYPRIVKELLQDMGAKCGSGQPQILTKCPTKNFCTLPNGELCVLGLNDANKLTQFSVNDLQRGGQSNTNYYWKMFLMVAIVAVFVWILYLFYKRCRRNKIPHKN